MYQNLELKQILIQFKILAINIDIRGKIFIQLYIQIIILINKKYNNETLNSLTTIYLNYD